MAKRQIEFFYERKRHFVFLALFTMVELPSVRPACRKVAGSPYRRVIDKISDKNFASLAQHQNLVLGERLGVRFSS